MLCLSRAGLAVARHDFRAAGSGRERVQAAQLSETAHVVDKVLHPDLGPGPHHADGPDQCAALVVGLRTEDMLDRRAQRGFGPVAALRLLGQRLAALVLAMDLAFQFQSAQLCLRLLGPIGRVCPDARPLDASCQQVIHRLAVVQRARQVARDIAKKEQYEVSVKLRKKVEMLFAHHKRILGLGRLRLRGPCGANDEFLLAATTQNLRKPAQIFPAPRKLPST